MTKQSPNRIAYGVHQMRKSAKLSQSKLAAMIGTVQSAISDLETGRVSNPTIGLLHRIASATGHRLILDFAHGSETKFDIEAPPWGKRFFTPFTGKRREGPRSVGYDIYLVDKIESEKEEVERLRRAWSAIVEERDALPKEEHGDYTRAEFEAGVLSDNLAPANASARFAELHRRQNEAYDAMHAARKSYYRANISLWGALMEVMHGLGCLIDVDRSGQPEWPENIPDEYWEFEYREGRWAHGDADINSPGRLEKLNRFHRIHTAIDAHLRWSPPGPVKGIPIFKLGSNDGWIVTPEEAFFAHSMIKAADPGKVEALLYSVQLDTPAGLRYWSEWVEYLERASKHGGFRVN